MAGVEGPSNANPASPIVREDEVSYGELRAALEKSYRNGNWRRLSLFERALYKACLGLARLRGRIVNRNLLILLRGIMGKMLKRFTETLLELGRMRAEELKKLYLRNGLLKPPFLRSLLEDRDYLLWLGAREILLKNTGFT